MSVFNLGVGALGSLNGASWVMFLTRAVRMFAFGATGVILALYLNAVGLSDERVGALMTGTLVGDAVIAILVTLVADVVGRRRMLVLGYALKLAGGAVFAATAGPNFWALLAAATIGVISPSGNEVGPFQSLEQSMLADQVPASQRTSLFAWYNLVGSVSTAGGSLATGFVTMWLVNRFNFTLLDAYRVTFAEYGGLALFAALVTCFLSSAVETSDWRAARPKAGAAEDAATQPFLPESADAEAGKSAQEARPKKSLLAAKFGLSKDTRGTVMKLAALFVTDSFAGGMVTGTLIAWYFSQRFGVGADYLGGLLFVANIVAGVSSLAAGWVAEKVGLVNTMVYTHLPSNVLLMLVPVMPNLHLATAMLFARFSISQMDTAPRASYVSGIVPASERTAAMGICNIVRSLGAALGPTVTGFLSARQLFDWAFYLAGGIKILYDLMLLWNFRRLRAEHETTGAQR